MNTEHRQRPQAKDHYRHPQSKEVYVLICWYTSERCGKWEVIPIKPYRKDVISIWTWFQCSGGGVRKWSFVLSFFFSEISGNSKIGHHNNSYLEMKQWGKAQAVVEEGARGTRSHPRWRTSCILQFERWIFLSCCINMIECSPMLKPCEIVIGYRRILEAHFESATIS